ncbi:molybdopterin/thiamine biosynthesis adenylyltransferase [Bradyrhizobium sp. USDA 4524]|uniref:ThiF family adenylyltransferase n=1 Tax=unclassified Bradyrhizobium TaxID=2631580 RepID=UPI0020A0075E|nr:MULTISPECIES: ThiF family adenylyltransferase [unclassified Bradyrhizobium]MCP1843662.1 molybdopterin/thiamine biosynthesis adenylyltransferase [Bradyrhizobium sp. USDA 4538]MCP1904228.1 molybdopterin/thiamine biosynthesis adenylyltransferase [Bradyrhizobium sp. USDA 4537]MCP1990116.1 molybdopterin/thiamine biosynthesis adenylyltransferase [Bradyrhizobium sp. USDA 4539]
MWWYLSDLARFRTERIGLDTLASDATWLAPVGWRTDDAKRLIYDADIVIGVRTFPVYLLYPESFPYTPPSVFPRGDKSRWSSHQFGAGDELCLEYGPDNWTSDITGAQLLESAHRLLSTENPEAGERGDVPSRHVASLGQTLRSTVFRLLVTRSLERFLGTVQTGVKLKANMLILLRGRSNVYVIDKVTLPDGTVWHNEDVSPTLGNETFERPTTVLRLEESQSLPPASNVDEFKEAAIALGLDADETTLVILKGQAIYGFSALDQSVISMVTIAPEFKAQRLDDAHAALRDKSVAIVGCGSMGGKIAAMLARAGVSDFYLIDDDLLQPDNLVRNELDWRDVGTHKADAVAQRIRNVNPAAKVFFRQIRLAGQEASGTADAALTSLVKRDLFVDATANPEVFNLLSAVAETAKRPMIWAEVFGGGFGGLIARCRPNLEPSPQLMRLAVENWFYDRDYKPKRASRDYATGEEGPVLIADDADITSIAAAATRLTIDTLIGRNPSYFPFSAYVLGLAPEAGLFSQAFESYPIEMSDAPPPEPKPELTRDEIASEVVEIVKIFSPK